MAFSLKMSRCQCFTRIQNIANMFRASCTKIHSSTFDVVRLSGCFCGVVSNGLDCGSVHSCMRYPVYSSFNVFVQLSCVTFNNSTCIHTYFPLQCIKNEGSQFFVLFPQYQKIILNINLKTLVVLKSLFVG